MKPKYYTITETDEKINERHSSLIESKNKGASIIIGDDMCHLLIIMDTSSGDVKSSANFMIKKNLYDEPGIEFIAMSYCIKTLIHRAIWNIKFID